MFRRNGTLIFPENGNFGGRRPFLSSSSLPAFVQTFDEATQRDRAIAYTEFGNVLRAASSAEFFAAKDSGIISKPTIKKYMKRAELTSRRADSVNASRARARADPRNAIACAAVTSACFSSISPEFLFNTDKVTLLIEHNVEKPKVVLSKSLANQLSEEHYGVHISNERGQTRSIPINFTTAADGKVLHVDVELWDRDINMFSACVVGDLFTFWLIPGNFNEIELTRELYTRSIIPAIQRKRAILRTPRFFYLPISGSAMVNIFLRFRFFGKISC